MPNTHVPATNKYLANLRSGWIEVANSQAPEVTGLSAYLDDELGSAVAGNTLDETALEDISSRTSIYLIDHNAADKATAVSQSLMKVAYEYLLAIDTLSTAQNELIGFEEITATNHAPHTAAAQPKEPELAVIAPDTLLTPKPETPSAQIDVPTQPVTTHSPETAPDIDVTDTQASDPEPTSPEPRSFQFTQSAPLQAKTTSPQLFPTPAPGKSAVIGELATKVGPHAEFHIADPKDMESPPPPLTVSAASDADAEAPLRSNAGAPSRHTPSSPPPDEDGEETTGKQGALTQNSDDLPATVIPSQPDNAALSQQYWRTREQSADPIRTLDDVSPSSGLGMSYSSLVSAIEQFIRQHHPEKAASLLQHQAQTNGDQDIAELALDTGDRCRALGKKHAALNCYLASMKADPLYLPALSRLADVSIDMQDIDTAVGYLERTAHLMRLRGDTSEALRTYRKIITLAPYREDILELLMKARANGQMDR